MPYYRIYRINPLGRIADVTDVECGNDDEALSRAATVYGPGVNNEVWQGSRLVKAAAATARSP